MVDMREVKEWVSGWTMSRFFERSRFQRTSQGNQSAGLPILLDDGGQVDPSFIDTTSLTGITELIADTAGAMVTGNTETGIAVTYQGADNTLDFVVDTEFIADTVGAMVTGNTETDISVTYQDVDNTLDFAVSSTLVGDRIHAATGKTTPVDADELGLVDSAASFVLKKLTWANLKSTFIGTVQTWTAVQTFISGTIVGSGSGAAAFIIDGGAAALRQVAFRTNGSNRWLMTTNSTAESGANAGSDFQIMSRTDAGAALRNDVTITRSSGAVALSGDLSAAGATFSSIQFSTVGATGSITTMGDGIWTPVITGSGSNPTVTYTTQTGRYLKWNTAVIVSCTITINTVSGGSGNVLISLPVAGNGSTHVLSVFCESVDFAVTPSSIVALTTVSAATCTIQALQDNASNSPLQVSGLAAGDTIRFSGIYFAGS